MPTPVTKKEAQADPVSHLFQAFSKPLLVSVKVHLSNQTQGLKLYQTEKRKQKKNISKYEVHLCQRELLCHLWQKALVLLVLSK